MLSVRDHMALDLAGTHFKHQGAREQAIRDTLGYSEVRHAQVVNALIDRSDAEAALPALVHRLRRIRSQRRAARAS